MSRHSTNQTAGNVQRGSTGTARGAMITYGNVYQAWPSMQANIESSVADYRFGDWLVQSAQNRLSRANESVQLDAKSMDVLVYLIENDGRVVSADELLDAIWPGRVVEQSTIHRRINQLRRALGDDPRQPDYLETIVKRGYRTIAPVVPLAPEVPAAVSARPRRQSTFVTRHRNRLMLALLALGLAGMLGWFVYSRATLDPNAAPTSITIAVLPFDSVGPDPDQRWIADGLTESLSIYLARVDWVVVKPLPRGFEEQPDLQQRLTRLNADVFVRGSVQGTADRAIVTAQLLRTSNQEQLWSAGYDLAPDEMFEVQRHVARSVVGAIEATLGRSPEVSGRSAIDQARFGTSDQRAYRLYRKALDLKFSKPIAMLSDDEIRQALEYNEQAITIDPEYSQGWVGLGFSYILTFSRGMDARDMWAAGDAFQRAVALDPQNPIAVGNLAGFYVGAGAWQQAVDLVEQVPSWRPVADVGQALESYFTALINLGQWEKARREFGRMSTEVRLAPHRFPPEHIVHNSLAAIAASIFRDDETAVTLVTDPEITADGYLNDARLALGLALRAAGRERDAVTLLAGDGPFGRAAQQDYARSEWRGLLEGLAARVRETGRPCRGVISVYAALGDAVQMYACFETAVAFRECLAKTPNDAGLACAEGNDFPWLPLWTVSSFDAYRDQPRFRALLDRAGVVGHEACCDDAIASSPH